MGNSVLDVVKKINKQWGDGVLRAGNIIPECDRISMGSLAADYPLFGGVPRGQITVFSGVEHSGKTLAAVQAVANYQKENPTHTCVYVDAEQTMKAQLGWLKKETGLDDSPEKLEVLDCSGLSAEEIFSIVVTLQQADNIGMIVIDSAPALVSQADLDNDFIKDNGQRASVAKSMGKFLRMMLMYLPKRNNALLVINQVRENKLPTGAIQYTEPCGYALKYFPSMKVRFGKRTFCIGDKTDITSDKGKDAYLIDGFRICFSVTKNRLGPTNRGGGFCTYRYDTGLDVMNDMLEVALNYKFIQRPTMQTYLLYNLDSGEVYTDEQGNELKFVGKAKVIEYFNAHPEFFKQYANMLLRNISGSSDGSILDDATLKGILDEEDSVSTNLTEEELAEKANLDNE